VYLWSFVREKVYVLVFEAPIVTMNNEKRGLERGYVPIRYSRITDVGVSNGLDKYYSDNTLRSKHLVVLPGLPCAHILLGITNNRQPLVY